ncbi:MAG: phosphoserine phosphatase SerB [Rhodospirillales bacterium]
MSNNLTLVAPQGDLTDAIVSETRAALNASGAETGETLWLSPARAADISFSGMAEADAEGLAAGVIGGRAVDACALPAAGRRKKLLIADMDSTILANETLDEIAAEAGIGEKVADITARSMRGELNFEESLRARVALLAGRDAGIIDAVLDRIELNPGARAFVATMRNNNAVTALVSGGFTMFTDRVQDWLGFHVAKANDFEIEDGRLTGRLDGPIVGRETKLQWLEDLGRKHDIGQADALTIGDGANDLAMVTSAGLGIAYHGKPILREHARARIDHTDLRTALYFQGYRDDEISEHWA